MLAYRGMDYEELPVLPEESANLRVHVNQCGRRYNALRTMLFDLKSSLAKERIISWTYRGTVIPLLFYIAFKLGLGDFLGNL